MSLPLDAAEIFHRLADLGFDAPGHDLASATEHYQAWHGLKADGIPGPITQRHLELPRFCGLPDRAPMRAEINKFPTLEVTYANAAAVPGFTLAQTQEITDMACAAWGKVSGLKLKRGGSNATIWLQVGRIDGKNGTLAWSELARRPRTHQMYDAAEPWKRGQGWDAVNYPAIDLLVVMAHELGHALGLDHAPGTGNLLSPIYSPSNATIGAWEINEMQKRYGKPEVAPNEPPATPSPTGGIDLFNLFTLHTPSKAGGLLSIHSK
jgi:hypothetical protein